EVVADLWARGVETNASCEGHDDWGYPMPWVDILAPIPGFDACTAPIPELEADRRRSLRSQIRVSEALGEFYGTREVTRAVVLALKPLGRFGAARLESTYG